MLQKQVLSSRFCRVASTRFKLYTPVYHQLVGGLEHFLFSHSVGNVIIPTDFHSFFQRGRHTTNQ
jgi:hypothetical protein